MEPTLPIPNRVLKRLSADNNSRATVSEDRSRPEQSVFLRLESAFYTRRSIIELMPQLSRHFQIRSPSPIRSSQHSFLKRTDGVECINMAIGNVTLPMHPALQERLSNLSAANSPFSKGVVKYTPSVGSDEVRQAWIKVLQASSLDTEGLEVHCTDGGSSAMELVVMGVADSTQDIAQPRPILVFDPAYSNYQSMAERTHRQVVSISRTLDENGEFHLPDLKEIEVAIEKYHPSAMLVIPADNPTGQFLTNQKLLDLAKLCVKYDLWMVSDEAYRELQYTGQPTSSIWSKEVSEVPGVKGHRISIESASKVWNACGLRIGAIITDNLDFHEKAVSESTATLCANAVGQYVFGALAHEPSGRLQAWFGQQRAYYKPLLSDLVSRLKSLEYPLIVSKPDAALYSVVDFRKVDANFDAGKFASFAAAQGGVKVDGALWTLLLAPMKGFYVDKNSAEHWGKRQLRLALVEPKEKLELVPEILGKLLKEYLGKR